MESYDTVIVGAGLKIKYKQIYYRKNIYTLVYQLTDNTIKIMGAGPAGLVAAINLAKAGYKVTIF